MFSWTDNEVELLLTVTNEYKVSKTATNLDWELVQKKQNDILDQFKNELEKVSGSGKGYPHKDKEITEQCPTAPSSVLLHQAVSYCTKQCPTAPSRRQQAVTKQCPLLIKQDASLTLLRLLGQDVKPQAPSPAGLGQETLTCTNPLK